MDALQPQDVPYGNDWDSAQVFAVLAIPGLFLVCDHTPFDDSPKSLALYMTEAEQQQVLADARFANVHLEFSMNGLTLYAGEKS